MPLNAARLAFVSSLLTLAAASPVPARAQVAVVMQRDSPVEQLSADKVSKLFTGRSTTLPNGSSAVLVDQPDGSAVREQFYAKVTGRSAGEMRAAWSRLMFSGKALPPKELRSTEAVREFVARRPDAVGYLEYGAVTDGVKPVLRVP